jgi:hypothetical protein
MKRLEGTSSNTVDCFTASLYGFYSGVLQASHFVESNSAAQGRQVRERKKDPLERFIACFRACCQSTLVYSVLYRDKEQLASSVRWFTAERTPTVFVPA